MFISVPQFVYCSHDEAYFPELSCLITADGSTLHSKWAQQLLCITFMTSKSHLWRYCCIVMSRGPWLLMRCFKRGFGDHGKQWIYEFNWTVISIEIQLIKLQMERKSHNLFVNSFKQQSLFRSNLTREHCHFGVRTRANFPAKKHPKFQINRAAIALQLIGECLSWLRTLDMHWLEEETLSCLPKDIFLRWSATSTHYRPQNWARHVGNQERWPLGPMQVLAP